MNILEKWLEKAKPSFDFLKDFNPETTQAADFLKSLTKDQRAQLLQHSVSLNPTSDTDLAILGCAAESDAHVGCIVALLDGFTGDEQFPFVKRADLDMCTALDYAILGNSPAKVRALWSSLSSEQRIELLNTMDSEGDTPLILAARSGNTEIVTILLDPLKQQLQTVFVFQDQGSRAMDQAPRHKDDTDDSMEKLLQKYGIPAPKQLAVSSSSASALYTPMRIHHTSTQPGSAKANKGSQTLQQKLFKRAAGKFQ